jgi:hypothetical protein
MRSIAFLQIFFREERSAPVAAGEAHGRYAEMGAMSGMEHKRR